MSEFRTIEIIEGTITVDEQGHGWRPDTSMLMHLLKFDDITGFERDIKNEGGSPKRYKVQIKINIKDFEPSKEQDR